MKNSPSKPFELRLQDGHRHSVRYPEQILVGCELLGGPQLEIALRRAGGYHDIVDELIASDPKVLSGKPCLRGTRIPVFQILELLAAGERSEDILRDYPALREEHLRAALQYAADLAKEEAGALG